jgi:hypothetical protein
MGVSMRGNTAEWGTWQKVSGKREWESGK